MMAENGMRLVYSKPLNEGYSDFIKKSAHEFLFGFMKACEPICRPERSGSAGDGEEYAHAYQFLEQHPDVSSVVSAAGRTRRELFRARCPAPSGR